MADENDAATDQEGADGKTEAAHLTDLATKEEGQADEAAKTTTEEEPGDKESEKADAKPAERPDWLPEKFWDKDKGEARLEALAKSYGELHSKSTKKSQAPKDPEGYESRIDDETAKHLGIEDASKDPLLQFGRKFAHEAGLDQETYGKLESGFIDLVKELVPAPLDPKTEMKKLGPHGQKIIDTLVAKRNFFKTAGVFSEANEQEFNIAVGTADGAQTMMKMIEFYEGSIVPQHAENPDGKASLDDIYARQAAAMEKNDEVALKRIQKELEEVVGVEPTGTSRPSPLPAPALRKA